jgi:hypothetical protein
LRFVCHRRGGVGGSEGEVGSGEQRFSGKVLAVWQIVHRFQLPVIRKRWRVHAASISKKLVQIRNICFDFWNTKAKKKQTTTSPSFLAIRSYLLEKFDLYGPMAACG